MEFNKIAGAVLLAGVIAMIAGTIAKATFGGYSHHHEGEEKRGYQIEVADATGTIGSAPVKEVDMAELLASAKIEDGANVAKKCVACHDFSKGGPNKVGPNLWGIVGAPHAHKADFQYSTAMKEKASEMWTAEALWKFLENPSAAMKGTKMAFAGVKKPEERAALIKYLNSMSDKPVTLPAVKK